MYDVYAEQTCVRVPQGNADIPMAVQKWIDYVGKSTWHVLNPLRCAGRWLSVDVEPPVENNDISIRTSSPYDLMHRR